MTEGPVKPKLILLPGGGKGLRDRVEALEKAVNDLGLEIQLLTQQLAAIRGTVRFWAALGAAAGTAAVDGVVRLLF